MDDVKVCNPPAYDEIGVKALYEKVVEQPTMTKYFPNKWPKGLQCDKAYFYNVWNTIHPDQVKAAIQYANEQRFTVSDEDAR